MHAIEISLLNSTKKFDLSDLHIVEERFAKMDEYGGLG